MTTEDEDTISILADLEACPECGANLVGDPIEPSRRELYGHRTHYSNLIGVSNGDAIQYYKCPKCEARFPAATGAGFRSSSVIVHR